MFQTNTAGKIDVIKQNASSDMKVAIVGINRIVSKILENPESSEKPGFNLIGFINIDPIDHTIDLSKFPRLLGGINEIKSIVRKYDIKKILVAVDPKDHQKLSEVIQYCTNEKIDYELLNNNASKPNNNNNINNNKNSINHHSHHRNHVNLSENDVAVANGEFVTGAAKVGYHYEKSIKEEKLSFKDILGDIMRHDPPPKEFVLQRFLDLLISSMLFLLFLPSWIVVAIAIRLESKGGVLYTQERVGAGGKVFKIYKFRSMYSDAEKRSGPILATHNDPRITRVGRILRRTRIDELPQLVNVLKGDMSLIGPRPERPYFIEKYDQQIPRYLERLKVKPGLTGFAQVETGYDESIEDVKIKLEYDLYYIAHRSSFKLYFKIMLKTVWVVLTAKGQ
jgi:lipopolysaccharide/colanic/teichoic acid biosynthesis glycosyltransferase